MFQLRAGVRLIIACVAILLVAACAAHAQTETILHTFNCQTDGCVSSGVLAIDKEGNLYGTAESGGPNGAGTVFKLTPSGVFSVLHSFSVVGGDGFAPNGGVTLDNEGNLYATTLAGGLFNSGTVFKVTLSGAEMVLHSFTCVTDGCSPDTGLAIDKGGNLYGTTTFGGAYNYGVVFELSASGTLIYGTTSLGGVNGFGAMFKVTPPGTETILHSFSANGADGFYPEANVILDSKGNLYGTTSYGGAVGIGTVFQLSASGSERILHRFTGGAKGISPVSRLVRSKSGNFYSTTNYGGSVDLGTVFELSPSGAETRLHCFARNGTDGYFPHEGLAEDSAGNLYGTTPHWREQQFRMSDGVRGRV